MQTFQGYRVTADGRIICMREACHAHHRCIMTMRRVLRLLLTSSGRTSRKPWRRTTTSSVFAYFRSSIVMSMNFRVASRRRILSSYSLLAARVHARPAGGTCRLSHGPLPNGMPAQELSAISLLAARISMLTIRHWSIRPLRDSILFRSAGNHR